MCAHTHRHLQHDLQILDFDSELWPILYVWGGDFDSVLNLHAAALQMCYESSLTLNSPVSGLVSQAIRIFLVVSMRGGKGEAEMSVRWGFRGLKRTHPLVRYM